MAALTTNGVTATMPVDSWGAGYCANITLANASTSAVTSWTLVAALHGTTLNNVWGATSSVSAGQVTLRPVDYNARIAPGASVSLGFCGTGSASPALQSLEVVGGGTGGPTSYTLTVTRVGAGSGTVTSTPAGIGCGATCSASYASGTIVTLTAAAAAGSTFAGWSGACTGTAACTVAMTAARTVTATFDTAAVIDATVSVNAGGAAAGTFVADAGFTGGSTYSTTAAIDTSLVPSPVPPAAVFQTERYGEFTYTIGSRTPGSAQTVTLYFAESYWTAAGQRTFNVAINGATVLTAFDIFAAAGGANRGIARTFETTASASGQVVIQFARGGGPDNPKVSGITVAAGGNGGTTYALTVTRAGTGSGTVTSNPAGISCGSTCSASYASGTAVTLAAAAASGSTFGGWSGACTGTGSCIVTMTAARSVTATFTGSTGGTRPSAGCGTARTLQNGTITLNGRTYILRVPDNYNNTNPYRLVVAYHWLGGTAQNVAGGNYYGLLPLSNNSTIFVAPMGTGSGSGTGWPNTNGQDLAFTDAILNQVQNGLCIDLNRIFATGFSYGAGMSYAIACDRANVFRGVALYAGGLLSGCSNGTLPIAYYHAHGLGDTVLSISGGRSMRDRFVRNNGCTAQNPPEPASGSGTHVCTNYQNCAAGRPVRWCAFDGGHVFDPRDRNQSSSWVPQDVWTFISQF
ncbi:MAG TPA: malectin domain-containing carbohydrate-binding protein [Anaeromyxobacter sp.]|nr:malectin domain-containing carbohydrate-binding protein [Anaeromyxobacter sp.]